jgi:hypothetical protein
MNSQNSQLKTCSVAVAVAGIHGYGSTPGFPHSQWPDRFNDFQNFFATPGKIFRRNR